MKNHYDEIGQRIGNLRRERHVTQESFAEAMDISVKHCSRVECGQACYSLDKLIEVADYFNVSMDYLVHGTKPDDVALSFPPTMVEIMRSNDEKEKSLLREYLNLYGRLRNGEPKPEDGQNQYTE